MSDDALAAWAGLAGEWLDLDALLAIARSAPPLGPTEPNERSFHDPAAGPARCRIGLAFDEAFHFYYEDNLRRLESLGAELVRFSPIRDRVLPPVDGLYFGGGYPELAAATLAANHPMREAVRAFPGPIYAECGGLMYLTRGIRTLDGALHAMVGRLPGEAIMADRLQALGYAEVETRAPSLLGPAGARFRGHQFRYSELRLSDSVERVYSVVRAYGEPLLEGYQCGNLLASYVHAHFASNPAIAAALVDACRRYASRMHSSS